MRWLKNIDGRPVEQFNQTVLVQAPAGATEADVVVVLQAVLDRHAMLRLRVDDDGAGGWSLTVPEPGSVDAAECLHPVGTLSDEALVEARSRLNPSAGMMLSALWIELHRQLVLTIHHLAVDAVSWWILLEDLNTAWAQHRSWAARGITGDRDVVCPVGGRCCPSMRAPRRCWSRRKPGRQVAAVPAALPAVDPIWIRTPRPRTCRCQLDPETTCMLLG